MTTWTHLAAWTRVTSERLVLRPLTFADRHRFFDMISNPANARFLLPVTLSQEESDTLFVETFLRQPLGVWGISFKEAEDDLLGLIRLDRLVLKNGRAELGYLLHQAYWGQGLMTEAVVTLTQLALNQLEFGTLTIVCHAENRASQRVAEKAGYRLLKRHKGSDRYTHKVATYLTYQLKAGEQSYE